MNQPDPLSPDDHLVADILGDDTMPTAQDPSESRHKPEQRLLRTTPQRRYVRMLEQQRLQDLLTGPPAAGESIHAITDGTHNFWTWVPVMTRWIAPADELHVSTWTVGRFPAIEALELFDAGQIRKMTFLCGAYFKRLWPHIFALLHSGLTQRGQRYRSAENHAKVLLLRRDPDTYLVAEGSANLTTNPRTEQVVLTNDRTLYDFHRTWIEEHFA